MNEYILKEKQGERTGRKNRKRKQKVGKRKEEREEGTGHLRERQRKDSMRIPNQSHT